MTEYLFRLYQISKPYVEHIDCGVVPVCGKTINQSPSIDGCIKKILRYGPRTLTTTDIFLGPIPSFMKVYSNYDIYPNKAVNELILSNIDNIVVVFGIDWTNSDIFVLIKEPKPQPEIPPPLRECVEW